MTAATAQKTGPILPNHSEVLQAARQLYVNAPVVLRTVQRLRPAICPFEPLIGLVPPRARVLDIGCGPGLFLGLLAAFGYEVEGIGFDTSASAIASARVMSSKTAPGARLQFLRLASDSAWPVGSFDVVVMIDVLHHIPVQAQRHFFVRATQKVSPGGILLYKDMCRRPYWKALLNRLHDLVVAQQWIHYVPADRVEQWAAECGLASEVRENFSRLWYGHELRVFRKGVPA
jgi:2-polyprenyl-3-methyl-5-hydroxy-6-metoxy-1,4-benzoquinol methylase